MGRLLTAVGSVALFLGGVLSSLSRPIELHVNTKDLRPFGEPDADELRVIVAAELFRVAALNNVSQVVGKTIIHFSNDQ